MWRMVIAVWFRNYAIAVRRSRHDGPRRGQRRRGYPGVAAILGGRGGSSIFEIGCEKTVKEMLAGFATHGKASRLVSA
jgi:hypothetical protein